MNRLFPILEEVSQANKTAGALGIILFILGIAGENVIGNIVLSLLVNIWRFIAPLIADNFLTIMGFFILLVVFFRANNEIKTRRKLEAEERKSRPSGIVIKGIFDTCHGEGRNKSIELIIRNDENEPIEIDMRAGAPRFAKYTDTHWQDTDQNLADIRFSQGWVIDQNTTVAREIARTESEKDSFWFAPNSGRLTSGRGYYSYWVELAGKLKKSRKKFTARKQGYFVYHGDGRLEFFDELPKTVTFN